MTTTTVNFSPDLLNLLSAVKEKKKLAITESMLGLCGDHYKSTKEYFDSLPYDLINRTGLKRNLSCFEAILSFPSEQLEALSAMSPKDLRSRWFNY